MKKVLIFVGLFFCFFITKVSAAGSGTFADPVILNVDDTHSFSFSQMELREDMGESFEDSNAYMYAAKITVPKDGYLYYYTELSDGAGLDIAEVAITSVSSDFEDLEAISMDVIDGEEDAWYSGDIPIKKGTYLMLFLILVDKDFNNNFTAEMGYEVDTAYRTEYEPNNTKEAANVIEINRMYYGGTDLYSSLSEDYYAVDLYGNHKTRIYVADFDEIDSGNMTIYVDKYNEVNHYQIIERSDLKWDNARVQYYYEFTPTVSGTYYINFSWDGTYDEDATEYGIGIYQSGTTNPSVYEDLNYYLNMMEGEDNYKIVFRMYNPVSGEHLYTTDAYEVRVIYTQQGWGFEGIGWITETKGTPVYRLYQPQLGNHLYTSDLHEIDVITRTQGWLLDFDGAPVMYSTTDTEYGIPIYRLYNQPLNGMHHLTTDENEYNVLPSQGWAQEGISMYAAGRGYSTATEYYNVNF